MAARPPTNKWLVALSVTFGTLMGTIDSSIVNVAVPHLRGSLGATVEEITWVSTGFIIANVIVMPLTAFFGRFFGQKRVYLAALTLFVIGSALCGLARSLPMLVVFRLIQGLGAGALQPTEQAILRQTFPPKEQGMAMALFGVAVVIGPAFGPTLGGYIVDNYTWPWIFYINLPVGALALFMVSTFVHEPEDVRVANLAMAAEQRKHLDWIGVVLLTIGVATLQYVLEEGQRDDWFDSKLITVLTVVSVVSGAAFVICELTAPQPVVNLRMFKDRTFASATIVGGVMYAMLIGSMFLLPVFTQELLGYDATQSGLALMPRTLAMLALTPIVGRLYNHVQPAIMVAIGVVLFAIGAYQLSHITLESSMWNIVVPLAITGFGFAALFIPLATVALEKVPRAVLADAAGLNSFVRQVGGSVGLTIFATLLGNYSKEATASVGAHVSLLRSSAVQQVGGTAQALIAHGLDPVAAHGAALRAIAGRVQLQGAVLGYERVFLLQGVVFLGVLPLLFLIRSDRSKPAAAHVEMALE